MMAINHALTGAVIGLTVTKPVIAIPLALVSHFVCDALPHFGVQASGSTWLSSKRFARLLVVDMLLCVALVAVLFATGPAHWLVASICAFVATSPDAFWLPMYIRTLKGQKQVVRPNWFMRFAAWIQWYERPLGALVEATWFSAGIVFLLAYL